jgi:hypothetical protein
MRAWIEGELARIRRATELEISSWRRDGSLRPFVTIWTVRSGDDIYVRSAHGWNNPWSPRAVASGEGRIRAGGVERDVAFEQPDLAKGDAVTGAYHAKYDRYGPSMVGTVVSAEAVRSMLRLVPR